MNNKKILTFFTSLIVLAALLAACQPQAVIETVVVTQEIEKEVFVSELV